MKPTWTKLFLGLILGSFLVTSIAFANPVEAKAEGEKVEREMNENKLGFTGLQRYDLFLYTLIVFGALIFILGKFAWKPIIAGLDKRENSLRNDHEAAEKARAEAQEVLNKIQKQLAETNDQVRGMLEEARKQGQTLKDSMKAEASKEAEAERDRSRREIETAKDQALQEIWTQAVQLASLISTKAVRRELTPSDQTQLVNESLAELKQTMSRA